MKGGGVGEDLSISGLIRLMDADTGEGVAFPAFSQNTSYNTDICIYISQRHAQIPQLAG